MARSLIRQRLFDWPLARIFRRDQKAKSGQLLWRDSMTQKTPKFVTHSQSYRSYGHAEQRGDPMQPLERLSEILRDGGYFDAAGNLRSEFVARDYIETLAKEMAKAKPPLTRNQVRRFFQHCRAIERRMRASTSNWEAERTLHFAILDRAAADACGKSTPKIPLIFHDFIQHNVAAVRTEKDFLEGFLQHFEALVAFGAKYFKEPRKG